MRKLAFVIEEHTIDGVSVDVVRDDLLKGGTKVRALCPLIAKSKATEFIYPSPAYGFAQIAIAQCCAQANKKATIFVAQRKELYPYTQIAQSIGANIVQVPVGYLAVVKKRALDYCAEDEVNRQLISWGAADEESKTLLTNAFKKISKVVGDRRVWICVGSGTLLTSMATAWPKAEFMCVVVGARMDFDSLPFKSRIQKVFYSDDKYEKKTKNLFPWPANSHYEAKMYPFVVKHAKSGDIIWNVAGDSI